MTLREISIALNFPRIVGRGASISRNISVFGCRGVDKALGAYRVRHQDV